MAALRLSCAFATAGVAARAAAAARAALRLIPSAPSATPRTPARSRSQPKTPRGDAQPHEKGNKTLFEERTSRKRRCKAGSA
eukprot:4604979-Pleurochrysis_carterae.AAC.1